MEGRKGFQKELADIQMMYVCLQTMEWYRGTRVAKSNETLVSTEYS